MKELTREELAHGRALLEAAFTGPWRYKQFEIECGACRAHEQGAKGDGVPECTNPECSSNMGDGEVPCTFVEAPECYPNDPDYPQVVATIDVPGLSTLAEKNGEAICWLRNEAPLLIEAAELLLDLRGAIDFVADRERRAGLTPTIAHSGSIVDYAKRLGWRGDK